MNGKGSSWGGWSFVMVSGVAFGLLLMVIACGRSDVERVGTREPYSVAVRLSTHQITVGDVVELQVSVTHPPGTRVELPDPADSEAITVRDRQRGRRELADELIETVHRYSLTSFHVGTHSVITGTVRFVSSEADPVERDVPEATLDVVSIRNDEDSQLAPLKGVLTWPGRVPRWVWVLTGIVLVALIGGLLLARFLRNPRSFTTPPPPPAHETALNALRLLKSKGYIEAGEVNRFYTELSAIVRRYLEDRFRLRAPESTTEEFIRAAAGAGALDESQQRLVADFLVQSDLVKFAQYRPGTPAMNTAYAAAERLIHETREAPREDATP